METNQENATKQDGRGNRLTYKTLRGKNQTFTLPKGRLESNCKKITLMVRPSVYERCKQVSGDHIAQLIRDAIDLYLNSIDKNSLSNTEEK